MIQGIRKSESCLVNVPKIELTVRYLESDEDLTLALPFLMTLPPPTLENGRLQFNGISAYRVASSPRFCSLNDGPEVPVLILWVFQCGVTPFRPSWRVKRQGPVEACYNCNIFATSNEWAR